MRVIPQTDILIGKAMRGGNSGGSEIIVGAVLLNPVQRVLT
jgi:hypothetical protein